jgi:hypothetical protein
VRISGRFKEITHARAKPMARVEIPQVVRRKMIIWLCWRGFLRGGLFLRGVVVFFAAFVDKINGKR